jgi:hypothetical protein
MSWHGDLPYAASFEKLLLALFAFGFCSPLQKRYEIDQLLNRQEVIVFAHCSSPLFHRVTWGCHDRMRFNCGFSKETNNPNPQTNFPRALVPVIREREKKPSEKATTEKPHCQVAIA